MMKTTLALAALAVTATATTVTTTKTADEVKDVAACTVVDAEDATKNVSYVFGTNVQNVNIVQVTGETEAQVNACVTAIEGAAVVADACFVADETTKVVSFVNNGIVVACPKATGAACQPKVEADDKATPPVVAKDAEFCQQVTVSAEGEVCPASGFCAYPAPKQSLVTVVSKVVEKTPDAISKAIVDARAVCEVTAPAYTAVADKKGVSQRSTEAIKVEKCDVDALKKSINTAVEAFNKDAKAEDKYEVTFDIKQAEVKAACFNADKNTFNCATVKDCDILCADKTVCTEDKQCGSGVCKEVAPAKFMAQEDPAPVVKQCFSNAVASVVAPVLAAALAIAFF